MQITSPKRVIQCPHIAHAQRLGAAKRRLTPRSAQQHAVPPGSDGGGFAESAKRFVRSTTRDLGKKASEVGEQINSRHAPPDVHVCVHPNVFFGSSRLPCVAGPVTASVGALAGCRSRARSDCIARVHGRGQGRRLSCNNHLSHNAMHGRARP